ncbi:MFS general substrate transporter [Pleurostoma richardsiae]|uniref:MFS general substrate transporter n=1 Tax=Pleurostoma richardsiae TaxID=41990 RepID=A0AA38RPZ7_9PEZI|nr:MFS general substrate transporter [Pleurostoma richardsiae]
MSSAEETKAPESPNNLEHKDGFGQDGHSATPDKQEYIGGIRLVLVLSALTLVYFLIMLDNTILATAIPYITDEFHSLLDVGWYGSAYQLACAALQPMTGKIYTRLSSKWFFLGCLVLFEVGSVICGAAHSSKMLIVGRAVAGMGGSGLLNGALIILNSCVPPAKQPALMGILMGIGQLGIAAGPLIGGAFTEYVTWRWCFYINLPIGGVVAAALIFIYVPDHLEKPSLHSVFDNAIMSFDLPGFVLFAPAAIMFFLALQYGGNQYTWHSSQVIGLFVGAGLTFILWLVWDWYAGETAMVPMSMMRKRVVWISCICGTFLAGTIFVTAYYLPLYFQAVLAHSPFKSGVDVLANIVAQMVFGVISGGMIQKLGYCTPFMIAGSVLNAVGCGLLGLLLVHTPTGQWVGYQILFGAGRGLATAVPFLAVQNSLPKDQIPAAMSILVFLQNFSAAVMIVLSQTIFTNSLVELIPHYAPGVDASLVIAAGSTRIRDVVPAASLGGVLLAYAKSLDRVWYFCAGIATPSFFFAFFMGWDDIREKKPQDAEGTEDHVQSA